MLYKIDKNGFVVNEACPGKIQPYYRKILEEINKLYNEKLGGIQSTKSSGFCSKWVRILSSKHHTL